MKQPNSIRALQRYLAIFAFVFAVVLSGQPANAQVITLTDENSFVKLDLGSPSGMFDWSLFFAPPNPIYGETSYNSLSHDWFWFRVGNLPERSIDSISAPGVVMPDARRVFASYFNGQFGVVVHYELTGSPLIPFSTGTAQLTVTATITNATAAPLDFHLFQYANIEFAAHAVSLATNAMGQFSEERFDLGSGSFRTIVSSAAAHGEVGLWPATLFRLNDNSPTTLNDSAGPLGPGDLTAALQWDLVIPPAGSVTILQDKYLQINFIPEPSIGSITLLGFAVSARRRNRGLGSRLQCQRDG